jgi:hypothetical protein
MNTELAAAVTSLGLEKFRRHIFLCTDADEPKCCPREQSLAAWDFLKQRLKELNLVGPHPLVFRSRANCLRVCTRGPIAVVYPEGAWYVSCFICRELASVLDFVRRAITRDNHTTAGNKLYSLFQPKANQR